MFPGLSEMRESWSVIKFEFYKKRRIQSAEMQLCWL